MAAALQHEAFEPIVDNRWDGADKDTWVLSGVAGRLGELCFAIDMSDKEPSESEGEGLQTIAPTRLERLEAEIAKLETTDGAGSYTSEAIKFVREGNITQFAGVAAFQFVANRVAEAGPQVDVNKTADCLLRFADALCYSGVTATKAGGTRVITSALSVFKNTDGISQQEQNYTAGLLPILNANQKERQIRLVTKTAGIALGVAAATYALGRRLGR